VSAADLLKQATEAAAEARAAESAARAINNARWPREIRVHDPECRACDGTGTIPESGMGQRNDMPCRCGALVKVVPLTYLAGPEALL
jgi:hypothetical protein